eukprot:PhF_6_TR1983/c1_g1_i4/m.3321
MFAAQFWLVLCVMTTSTLSDSRSMFQLLYTLPEPPALNMSSRPYLAETTSTSTIHLIPATTSPPSLIVTWMNTISVLDQNTSITFVTREQQPIFIGGTHFIQKDGGTLITVDGVNHAIFMLKNIVAVGSGKVTPSLVAGVFGEAGSTSNVPPDFALFKNPRSVLHWSFPGREREVLFITDGANFMTKKLTYGQQVTLLARHTEAPNGIVRFRENLFLTFDNSVNIQSVDAVTGFAMVSVMFSNARVSLSGISIDCGYGTFVVTDAGGMVHRYDIFHDVVLDETEVSVNVSTGTLKTYRWVGVDVSVGVPYVISAPDESNVNRTVHVAVGPPYHPPLPPHSRNRCVTYSSTNSKSKSVDGASHTRSWYIGAKVEDRTVTLQTSSWVAVPAGGNVRPCSTPIVRQSQCVAFNHSVGIAVTTSLLKPFGTAAPGILLGAEQGIFWLDFDGDVHIQNSFQYVDVDGWIQSRPLTTSASLTHMGRITSIVSTLIGGTSSNMYFVSPTTHVIYRYKPQLGVFAGIQGTNGDYTNAAVQNSTWNSPYSITAAIRRNNGILYVTDRGNFKVKRISLFSGVVTVVVGQVKPAGQSIDYIAVSAFRGGMVVFVTTNQGLGKIQATSGVFELLVTNAVPTSPTTLQGIDVDCSTKTVYYIDKNSISTYSIPNATTRVFTSGSLLLESPMG